MSKPVGINRVALWAQDTQILGEGSKSFWPKGGSFPFPYLLHWPHKSTASGRPGWECYEAPLRNTGKWRKTCGNMGKLGGWTDEALWVKFWGENRTRTPIFTTLYPLYVEQKTPLTAATPLKKTPRAAFFPYLWIDGARRLKSVVD